MGYTGKQSITIPFDVDFLSDGTDGYTFCAVPMDQEDNTPMCWSTVEEESLFMYSLTVF